MIQRRCRSRFLRESLQAVTVRREGRRQNFDRDSTIQPGIMGSIHFAIPPAPIDA